MSSITSLLIFSSKKHNDVEKFNYRYKKTKAVHFHGGFRIPEGWNCCFLKTTYNFKVNASLNQFFWKKNFENIWWKVHFLRQWVSIRIIEQLSTTQKKTIYIQQVSKVEVLRITRLNNHSVRQHFWTPLLDESSKEWQQFIFASSVLQ